MSGDGGHSLLCDGHKLVAREDKTLTMSPLSEATVLVAEFAESEVDRDYDVGVNGRMRGILSFDRPTTDPQKECPFPRQCRKRQCSNFDLRIPIRSQKTTQHPQGCGL